MCSREGRMNDKELGQNKVERIHGSKLNLVFFVLCSGAFSAFFGLIVCGAYRYSNTVSFVKATHVARHAATFWYNDAPRTPSQN
ncbi:hypothetical protein BJY01DRAFT_177688 [Aspergillus pseudoustus]|uniref:Transmembrane protein n=1 Tax=Aspergillus pseudoustus TaxID=1810923 RepID=A0ABR4K051_9EURO